MIKVITGDCLEVLKDMSDQSIDCCVTSPPYWLLRDYGHPKQIGVERDLRNYIAKLVGVFREVRRVLKDDGTLWLNINDTYAGGGNVRGNSRISDKQKSNRGGGGITGGIVPMPHDCKPKDLCGIPWKLAFALQDDGWYLRQDIIWHKPNPMPEPVRDRCTKAHEYVFLLSKSRRYYYDTDAVKEQSVSGETRNRRSVWTVTPKPFKGAHFAVFPPDLIEPCILAGCPEGGTVLDPFGGSGTTGVVALENNRRAILIELNPEYAALAQGRICRPKPRSVHDVLWGTINE